MISDQGIPILCEGDKVTRGLGWNWGNEVGVSYFILTTFHTLICHLISMYILWFCFFFRKTGNPSHNLLVVKTFKKMKPSRFQNLVTSPVVTPTSTRAFCINNIWCRNLLPQLTIEITSSKIIIDYWWIRHGVDIHHWILLLTSAFASVNIDILWWISRHIQYLSSQ